MSKLKQTIVNEVEDYKILLRNIPALTMVFFCVIRSIHECIRWERVIKCEVSSIGLWILVILDELLMYGYAYQKIWS